MQEHVQSSQPPTEKYTRLSNDDALYFRAAEEGLAPFKVGRERAKVDQLATAAERPPVPHEIIDLTSQRIDHFRLWEQKLDEEIDFKLWEQELNLASVDQTGYEFTDRSN